jgi:hypothetical protein
MPSRLTVAIRYPEACNLKWSAIGKRIHFLWFELVICRLAGKLAALVERKIK